MSHPDLNLVVKAAEGSLRTIMHRSGKILYSSASTLKPGPLYILGFNPGGDPELPECSHYTIAEAIRRLPHKSENDYVDECWQGSKTPGGKPLQRRIQWLCSQLGQDPRDVCASNLIFIRSRDRAGCEYPYAADLCWPVHERILDIVRPRLIVVFDSLVYRYCGMRFAKKTFRTIESRPSGHGNWICKRAVVSTQYGNTNLVQVPHLSRYNIIDKTDVVNWLRMLLDSQR